MTKGCTYEQRGKSLQERFWEKVDKSDGCWLWTSAIGSRGYGVFWVGGGKSRFAHRISWELANGVAVPDGMVVMHSCDRPACVNPSHLSTGTNKDNSEDAVRKLRHAFGERNKGGGKLTDQQVLEMKRLQADGYGCSRLSRMFNVSTQTAKAIKRGRIWKHITVQR